MSNINKAAVLNPFTDLTANVLDYVPRATTSEFGIVAIGSGISVDNLGRIYLDTQEYSDRLTAIDAHVASTLATQKSEVAAAIAQVNLTQSQTITALTIEVSNLKTNLINRADQLAQNVTDITNQLTQDKAAFTQEIQDALVYLENEAAVASALRTPRKINGTDFDGRSDITTNAWGATRTFKIGNKTNSINGTSNVDFSLADIGAFPDAGGTIQGNVEVTGNLSVDGAIIANLTGTAASADKLQTPRTISLTGGATGSVSFDGSANVSIATAVTGLGVANGIATLDSNGQVPSTQLPSYVDDVLEYLNVAAFPATGETGKIYVETTGNTTYRWSGSAYVKITSGEVASVAGKTGVVSLSKADVGLDNVDNTPDAQKPISVAMQQALDSKADKTVTQSALNDKVNKADVIDITKGGTGASTKEQARVSLGTAAGGVLVGPDFNTLRESGLFFIKPEGGSNNPVLNWGYLTVISGTGSTIQKYTPDTDPHISYIRQATVNTWSNWSVFRAIPDGVGVGLPSDLRNIATPNPAALLGYGLRFGLLSQSQIGAYNSPWYAGLILNAYHDDSAAGANPYILGFGAGQMFLKTPTSSGNAWFRTTTMLSDYNTAQDGNGFIKGASPVVDLYADRIEANDQAKQQDVSFEKLGIGDYLIKGSLGFAQTGWYVEQPKDANGNIFHAVVYDTLDNGDLSIKTYECKLEGVNSVADLTKPVDIKENRFISIRLHEEQEGTTAPINPVITDNEGNAAPTRYHTLEEGVWSISEEDVAKLEQERLAAMQPLKRRQFRLTLAMNGYDLKEIGALIDQIEDPMQRTIAQIEWQDATEFERTNPTLLMMAEMLQLTSEQIDQLWSYGLAL